MRELRYIIISLLLPALLLCGCAAGEAEPKPAEAGAAATADAGLPAFSLAHTEGASRALHQQVLLFAAALRDAGAAEAVIYADAALGGDEELIGLLSAGALDMAFPLAAAFSRVEDDGLPQPAPDAWQDFAVFDEPWRFADCAAALEAANGPLGETLTLGDGLRILGYVCTGGEWIASRVPLGSPDDLQGLRFAVADAGRWQPVWRQCGATTREYRYYNIYQALADGDADATVCGLAQLVDLNYTEVAPYLLPGPCFAVRAVVVRSAWYDALGDETRLAFDQALAALLAGHPAAEAAQQQAYLAALAE